MNTSPSFPLVETYLFFGGKCEEALNFYAKHLGAKTKFVIRFNESPDPVPEGMLPEGFENKIMHSEFTIGETKIMASDGCLSNDTIPNGFSLALTVENKETAEKVFTALADGGTVLMPLSETF